MYTRDFNAILAAERDGKLSGFTKDELREMRNTCARHLQVHNQIATHAIGSIDNEIQRMESSEAELRANSVARQIHQETITVSQSAIRISKRAFWFSIVAFVVSLV